MKEFITAIVAVFIGVVILHTSINFFISDIKRVCVDKMVKSVELCSSNDRCLATTDDGGKHWLYQPIPGKIHTICQYIKE